MGKITRRDALTALGGTALGAGAVGGWWWWRSRPATIPPTGPVAVNDIHSALNPAQVERVVRPESIEDVIAALAKARRNQESLAICGSRHAMGGQQFLDGGWLMDTRGMNQVMDLDTKGGWVDVEAGVEWPSLVAELERRQPDAAQPWTIKAKQTGADKLTLGGALAANAHGRTLESPPMVVDIDSIRLVTVEGDLLTCSREENPELFSLAIGGYGLFGVIHSARLKLERRHKIERRVESRNVSDLIDGFDERIREGFTLGDWQFQIDDKSPGFLQEGVFSCYRPVPIETKIDKGQDEVSDAAWKELVYLAHQDKGKGFELYRDYYLKTDGQVYWSDLSQIGTYFDGYHQQYDERVRAGVPGSEMISELYVPRPELAGFLADAAEMLRERNESVIYGTVRLIEPDETTFLAWAKQRYACIIFNLHVDHSKAGKEKAAGSFRELIDLARSRGGSYYLTYHRWATKEQALDCYPQMPGFLAKKDEYDPSHRIDSDWHRGLRETLA